MTDVVSPTFLMFVIKRFMREMKKCVKTTVGWTTHTQYAPLFDDEDPYSIAPLIDPKTKATIVPAIGLVGPDIRRNQLSYTAHLPEKSAHITRVDGKAVEGYELYQAPWIVNISFEVQLFHNRKMSLFNFCETFRRYMTRNPNLVIPADLTDLDANTIPDHAAFISEFWSTQPSDQTREGLVIYQHIPNDAPMFSSTAASNDDNLFISETSVVLENVPIADTEPLDEVPPIEEIVIDFYDLADETETVQESFSITEEE